MKTCPMCQAAATDDAAICYDCLYSFELMSCAAMATENEGAAEEAAAAVEEVAAEPGAPLSNPAMFEVVVADDQAGEQVFPLDSGSLHVGRLPTNDVVLNDRTISRRHLHVFFENGDVWVEDFGPTNPTLINGVALNGRAALHEGDVVKVRSATLTVRRKLGA